MNRTTDAALLGAIMQAAVDAIIVYNESGDILRVNNAAKRLFGYDGDELIGLNMNVLMPAVHVLNHEGFMGRHLEYGEKYIIGNGRDVEGVCKDGKVFPLHLSVGQAEFKGEKLLVGILHDLTQRYATQQALTRTQRLDAIGQMTGGIAHDFNNLLTVIIGNLELLERRCNDGRNGELLSDAMQAAELGADLISRLKVFARKSDLKPVATDLREVCDATLSILKRTLTPNYKITTQYDADIDMVLIDQTQLKSTIVNLVMNAIDAMQGSGELMFTISNAVIDDAYIAQEVDIKPGAYVRLSVSDTGGGMTLEAQRRAFEPFFTTKADGGIGLGLAMVHGFLRQSGGYITLYSELGIGTSFGLYFPAMGAEAMTVSARTRISGEAQHWMGKHILIVEDNPKVLKLSAERIRNLGFQIHEAKNGDEAYALLQSGLKVDVVFTDLVMPGKLNGYGLAEKVCKEFPGVKLLITSGYASDVLSNSLPHAVQYDILHKPYRQADLLSRLTALFADES